MLKNIAFFFGHLHPALVHLPIGFLLMALLLWYLSGRPQYGALSAAVPIVLLAGVLSAVLTCITGMLLSSGGEYEGNTVNWHMWMGIATTLVSAWLYSQLRSGQPRRQMGWTSLGLLVLVSLTGHLGGTLTHGSDYLSSPFKGQGSDSAHRPRAAIPDVQQAIVFNDIVAPILSEKCYSCHGPEKQKGKLRMDQAAMLMQGGKHGPVIVAGNSAGSELIKRLRLPLDDDHHMAPKEKAQLTAQEVVLLAWWIDQGARVTAKVADLQQPAAVKLLLAALQGAGAAAVGQDEEHEQLLLMHDDEIPDQAVPAVAEKDLAAIRALGVWIEPVAQGSPYLQMNCMNAPSVNDRLAPLLQPLRRQLVLLKLSRTGITDATIQELKGFDVLLRLELDHTAVTDKGMRSLGDLPHLKTVDLAYTNVTAAGVRALRTLPALQTVYLYQAKVDRSQWAELQADMERVRLDSGGYRVPTLPTDTQIVKPAMPVVK